MNDKKRIYSERSWCKQGVRYCKRCEYEIVDKLSTEIPVATLCEIMSVNRSGYYKWKSRKGKLNRYKQNRFDLTSLLKEVHKKHSVYGYHNLAKVFIEGIDFHGLLSVPDQL